MQEEKVANGCPPQGDGEYVVKDGDCMASIAFDYGFLPETLFRQELAAAVEQDLEVDPERVVFPRGDGRGPARPRRCVGLFMRRQNASGRACR
jgi:hypothetical protein